MKRLIFTALLLATCSGSSIAQAQFNHFNVPTINQVTSIQGHPNGNGFNHPMPIVSHPVATNGQYSNGNGVTFGWNGGYRDPRNFNGGVTYSNSNSNGFNGSMSNSSNGFTTTGNYNSGNGTTYGWNGGYRDPRNFNGNVSYGNVNGQGFGGSLSRNNGMLNTGGQFSTPGTIPGTRINTNANVIFVGRDTTVTGGGSVTDPTGRVRFSGNSTSLDRRGIVSNSNAGFGGYAASQSERVRLSGVNSTYVLNQGVRVPGIGGGSQVIGVSRNGITANESINVGGARLGVSGGVSGNGISLRPVFSVPNVNISAPSGSSLNVGGVRL